MAGIRRFTTGVVLALLAGMLQVLGASTASALALPPGFQLLDYPTGQAPKNLTNFAWLEDGGLLAGGKDGTVTFTAPGGVPHTLTKVPGVRAVTDHGMLGFALANDYATSGRVYLSYDKRDPASTVSPYTGWGMVEEWVASPPASPTDFSFSRVVLDGAAASPPLAQTTTNHGIDAVVVAPDDTLFLSIGDDARNEADTGGIRAQDLNQPYGKLLHLTPDGAGVPGNPFYSASAPNSWKSRVYASGFRNPFRFALDPRSGIPHLGDVGLHAWEEVNVVQPGANGGWPCYEGTAKTNNDDYAAMSACQALYKAGSALVPAAAYQHNGEGAAVVGGVHYKGTSYPEKYRNSFFYGDYTRGQLWTIATDLAGKLTRGPEAAGFATDAGAAVAFQSGPNGDVTFGDLLAGTVRRLVYTAGNRAPAARIGSVTDPATRTVGFSAADSYDLDGDALTYTWDFGDGGTGTGVDVDHTYAGGVDSVEVTLTVRDQLQATGTAKAVVYPGNHTPKLTFTTPAPRTYAVGDLVELKATGTDVEDGATGISWDTALLHCPFPNSCHLHPDDTSTGATYSRPFTDHGSDTTMLVTARTTDSKGATATATYEAKPSLRTLAVNSPVAVQLNGVTAASQQVVAGAAVSVSAPSSSSYWQFVDWSDGGAASHVLTMPDSDLTLTAQYQTAIAAKYAVLGGAGSVVGTPTTLEYDVPGGRARNFKSGRIYWSAASGAHELHGAILTKYLSGGVAKFGFPTNDQVKVTGGYASHFTVGKARIYYSSATGAHYTRGSMLAKYLDAGGPAKYGLPITDDAKVTGGYYTLFSGGRGIFYTTKYGARLVYGKIFQKYAALKSYKSCLGWPTTSQYNINGGVRNRFAKGQITYITKTKKTSVKCT
jgi:glucose/arabinose dehydrogenase/uncharacterized protein with LGFP repeats